MSNDLTVPQSTDVTELVEGLPALPDNDQYKQTIGAVDYFPYIVLTQGQSDIVSTKGCKVGNFFIIDNDSEDPIDLGDRFDCIMLSFRMKAMAYNDDEVINIYDTQSNEFESFQKKANEKVQDTYKYLWGVEYLVWLPDQGRFVTFFCNNPTLRRASKETIHKLLRQKSTITHKFIEKKDYRWWGAVGTPCTQDFNMPDKAETTGTVERFNNPPDRSVQTKVLSEEESTEGEVR